MDALKQGAALAPACQGPLFVTARGIHVDYQDNEDLFFGIMFKSPDPELDKICEYEIRIEKIFD